MSGSNLIFNLPQQNIKHQSTLDRNTPFQHILESIYRSSDNKNLAEILNELYEQERAFLWEFFVAEENQTVFNLTRFQFNPAKDELYVNVAGVDCLEGTDKQYIKTGPTQITFNFPLKAGYEVIIALMGTKSGVSFGSEIVTPLQKFTQLVDTPATYTGNNGKFLRVNDEGTGLIFTEGLGLTNLAKYEYDIQVATNSETQIVVPFTKSGIIKGIKCMPESDTNFEVYIWTKVDGYWIYYSGLIENVLWDIMDIPFIDESENETIFVKIKNFGLQNNFKLQIFIVL